MVCLDTRAREKYQWNRIDRSIDRWKTPDTLRLPLVERLRAGALLSFLVNQRSFVIPEGRLGKPHNYRHHRALHTGNRSYITWNVCAHAIDSCKTMFYCMGPLPSYGRHRSFALFLGRPVCQLLYRMDVEICTGGGGGNEMFYSRNKICLTQSYRMTSRSRMKLLWHF